MNMIARIISHPPADKIANIPTNKIDHEYTQELAHGQKTRSLVQIS